MATALGLSHSTVSLALRGDERISQATRLRIREAAQRMGYRPHLAGRALVSRRTHAIGFMMGGAHLSPFEFISGYSTALRTFSRSIQAQGYHLLISADATDSTSEEESLVSSPMLTTRMVDGLLILHAVSDPLRAALHDLGAPLVVLDAPPEDDFCCIGRDEKATAERAVLDLVGLGHRSVVMFNLDETVGHSSERPPHPRGEIRRRAYHEAMRAAGLTVPDVPVRAAEMAAWVAALCDIRPMPTALLAYDSHDGEIAARELLDRGLSVPRDISILALHESSGARQQAYVETPITSFELQHAEMGQLAARSLLGYINDPERMPSSVMLAPVLGKGGSVAPAPAAPRT